MRVDAVALQHVGEVALQLGLLREVLTPVVARFERVAVEVIADVDAAPGVRVLVPRAADAGVLLDDRERDTGFLQPDTGEQPGLSATDDDDGERRACVLVDVEVHLARVDAVELHLLEHHRDVLLGHVLAHEPRHHLAQERAGRRGRGFAAAVPVVTNDVQRPRAHLGLVGLGHVALHLVEEQALRAQLAPDDRRIAGHVDHRQHQGRDADVFERGGDGVVVVGDRRSGMGIASRRVRREGWSRGVACRHAGAMKASRA